MDLKWQLNAMLPLQIFPFIGPLDWLVWLARFFCFQIERFKSNVKWKMQSVCDHIHISLRPISIHLIRIHVRRYSFHSSSYFLVFFICSPYKLDCFQFPFIFRSVLFCHDKVFPHNYRMHTCAKIFRFCFSHFNFTFTNFYDFFLFLPYFSHCFCHILEMRLYRGKKTLHGMETTVISW